MRRLLILVASLVLSVSVFAQGNDKKSPRKNKQNYGISREHRLPCNGEVSLYYGDTLIWKKESDEIRAIEELETVPDSEGKLPKTGLSFRKLIASMPNVTAVELESCQPRLRRFDRSTIDSEEGDGLYLIATTYRGFRLHRVGKKGRGQGMKNIGRIRLIPSDTSASKLTPESAIKKAPKHQ